MDAASKKRLSALATRIRMLVIEGTYNAKSGHPGGSLSIADTLAYLYFQEMQVDPAQPKWSERDRLVPVERTYCPGALRCTGAQRLFPEEEIRSLRHTGAMLQGHPDMKGTPGVDMSTGSLGQGISAAAGMALAGKLDGRGLPGICDPWRRRDRRGPGLGSGDVCRA